MKQLIIIFFTALAICATSLSYAQISNSPAAGSLMRFTLAEAQTYALQNNYNIQNAKLDIAIAKQKVRETTAIGLPQVSATAKYQNMLDIPTSLIPAQFFGGEPGTYMPVKFGTQHNASWGITASQLVFSGEYIVGLQAAQTYRELSEKNLVKTERDTKEDVADAYYSVLLTVENKKVIEASVENTTKILQETEQMFQAGFVEETNVSQLRLTLSNLKNTLTTIQLLVDITQKLFKLQIGLDPATPIELTETLEQLYQQTQVENVVGTPFDINRNIDYQLLLTQEGLMQLNLKRQYSTFLPSIAAFYTYQKSAMRTDFNIFKTGSNYDWFPTSIVGVQIDLPIFGSGMKYARVQQSKLELQKVQNSLSLINQALKLNYSQAVTNLLTAKDKLISEKENMDLAKSILDKTVIKYREGIAASLELTQVQNQYLNTQGNYYKAIVDMLSAKSRLENLIND